MKKSMSISASYSREKRILWYKAVEREKKKVSEVCRIFSISRKTYYKWRKRDFGLGGNTYSPRMEKRNTKMTWEVRTFIEKEKRRTNYGPLKMKLLVKRELGIDISTTIIYRYYKRRKLIRKPQRKYSWYSPMKEKLVITKPGEGIQLDVKYVYEKGRKIYQFSVFDPYTEKYHFTIFPTKESKNAIVALQNAERYFRFKAVSIQTDNGSEFRGYFHYWLTHTRKISHYFIPKKSPWWNGKVERVHRTMDEEYYQNTQRVWKSPYEWLHYYNFERIHLTLNGKTPHEKWLSVTLDC
ncbi:MAG: transposase [Candidatus Moranbacteria bacterium]|nr:transposase [Candidatus Moranbacteria bacterium]